MKPKSSKPLSTLLPPKQARRRTLDADEAELWQKVRKTVKPIDTKRQNRIHWLDEMDSETQIAVEADKNVSAAHPILEKNQTSAATPLSRKFDTAPYSPPVSKSLKTKTSGIIDERTAKKLLKGKVSIDARIDLHGMTQLEAHTKLQNFLMQNHHAGKRMVLVITGKGRLNNGILRNVVPAWMREPQMAVFVSAFRSAHISHGGEGALYVRLRRKEAKQ